MAAAQLVSYPALSNTYTPVSSSARNVNRAHSCRYAENRRLFARSSCIMKSSSHRDHHNRTSQLVDVSCALGLTSRIYCTSRGVRNTYYPHRRAMRLQARVVRFEGKNQQSKTFGTLSIRPEINTLLQNFDKMISIREEDSEHGQGVELTETEMLDEESLKEVESQIEASLALSSISSDPIQRDFLGTQDDYLSEPSGTVSGDRERVDSGKNIVIDSSEDAVEDYASNSVTAGDDVGLHRPKMSTMRERKRRRGRRSGRRSKISMRKYGPLLKWIGDNSSLERDFEQAMIRFCMEGIISNEQEINESMTKEQREIEIPNYARKVWQDILHTTETDEDREMLRIIAPHIIRIVGPLNNTLEGGIAEAEEIARASGFKVVYREVLKIAAARTDLDACLRSIQELGEQCTYNDYRIAASVISHWTTEHDIGSNEAVSGLRKFEQLLSKAESFGQSVDRFVAKCGVLCCLAADEKIQAEELARRFSGDTPCATLFAPIIELSSSDKALSLFAELPTMNTSEMPVEDTEASNDIYDGEVIPAERAVAYQAVFTSCAINGNGQAALSLYHQLEAEGIDASHSILLRIFQAFLRSDTPLWRESCLLMSNIQDRSQALHVDLLALNIKTCALCGEYEAAYSSLCTALKISELKPTLAVLRSCLESCQVSRESSWKALFSNSTYAAECRNRLRIAIEIFKMYDVFKVGHSHKALHLFGTIVTKVDKEMHDFSVLFNVGRLANVDGKGVEMIFSVLNNFVPDGMCMNDQTYEIACNACADVGLWQEAKDLLQNMAIERYEEGYTKFTNSNVIHAVVRAHRNGWSADAIESIQDILQFMNDNEIELDTELLKNAWEDDEHDTTDENQTNQNKT